MSGQEADFIACSQFYNSPIEKGDKLSVAAEGRPLSPEKCHFFTPIKTTTMGYGWLA